MNSLDSHLYSSIRRKKTKRNNRLSPSLSLSLPPFFRARHARETAGGFIRVRGFLPCTTRHGGDSSSRRPKKMPPVSGSQWRRSSARFVGRRARLRGALRSAGDWLSRSGRRDGARPPRHTDPYEDAPSLVLGGHRMCFVSAPTELSLSPSSSLSLCISLFVSLSLSGNERSAPERSRTQGCWPAVTHPSAGCHSIYSLEDRAGGWRMME